MERTTCYGYQNGIRLVGDEAGKDVSQLVRELRDQPENRIQMGAAIPGARAWRHGGQLEASAEKPDAAAGVERVRNDPAQSAAQALGAEKDPDALRAGARGSAEPEQFSAGAGEKRAGGKAASPESPEREQAAGGGSGGAGTERGLDSGFQRMVVHEFEQDPLSAVDGERRIQPLHPGARCVADDVHAPGPALF